MICASPLRLNSTRFSPAEVTSADTTYLPRGAADQRRIAGEPTNGTAARGSETVTAVGEAATTRTPTWHSLPASSSTRAPSSGNRLLLIVSPVSAGGPLF